MRGFNTNYSVENEGLNTNYSVENEGFYTYLRSTCIYLNGELRGGGVEEGRGGDGTLAGVRGLGCEAHVAHYMMGFIHIIA
jgi:hypothetical protein